VVFSVPFLHVIRGQEIGQVAILIPKRSRILELGAGTGYQAKQLQEQGHEIVAIDVEDSSYAPDRVFPVIVYDGKTFPIESGTIDVVLSSNVLEHIYDLSNTQREIKRVLKPDGFCIHVLPSTAWRFWTTLSGWLDAFPATWERLSKARRYLLSKTDSRLARHEIEMSARTLVEHLIPRRHGERGNAFTELWTFGTVHWCAHFRSHGFEIVRCEPMGLFYTGFMLAGARLSIRARRQLARWFGSACNLYVLRPQLSS
jgi:SAM-dependent methyltransferase